MKKDELILRKMTVQQTPRNTFFNVPAKIRDLMGLYKGCEVLVEYDSSKDRLVITKIGK